MLRDLIVYPIPNQFGNDKPCIRQYRPGEFKSLSYFQRGSGTQKNFASIYQYNGLIVVFWQSAPFQQSSAGFGLDRSKLKDGFFFSLQNEGDRSVTEIANAIEENNLVLF